MEFLQGSDKHLTKWKNSDRQKDRQTDRQTDSRTAVSFPQFLKHKELPFSVLQT